MEANSDNLLKQRAMIEFFHAEGIQNAAEIRRRLIEMYGTNTTDVSNVRRWVSKATFFSTGEISIHDALRSGRPITVTTDQHHARIDDIIRGNRRIK
ncbi:UNVERIFIED_CONTAM: hypothetical protein RMT77_001965 [Armadillidium vulgare]